MAEVFGTGDAEPQSLAERQLAALSEIGQTIVSGVDYERVLAALIEKVARVLGARGGGFMLYDEASGELVTQRPAFGLPDEMVDAYRVPLHGGGNAATVFVTGEPYFTNDAQADPRVIRFFAELHGITKLLTVPLQVEGRSIGVYHAIDKQDGDFTPDDVALMALISPQLAVIIQSAGVMRRLRKRERQLGRALEVHEELIDMLLSGEGTTALVERLSQLLRMPALLTDPCGQIITSDESALAGADLDPASLQGLLTDALEDDDADAEDPQLYRHIAGDEGGSLTAVPVHAGQEILGQLAAWSAGGQVADDEVRVMQQAAVLFALELVRERQLSELGRRLDADILEQVFRADTAEEATAMMARLGVARAEGYRGAMLEVVAEDVESTLAGGFQTIKARAQRQLRSLLAESHGDAAVVERGNAFWLVVPYWSAKDPDQDRTALRRFAARVDSDVLSRREYGFLMGLGEVVEQVTDLRASFDQAAVTIEICRQGGPRDAAVFFDELGVYRLLAQPSGIGDLRSFVDAVLGPLLHYDERRQASWLEFLETLVDANFGMTATAARSGLHINTVKYRVARMQELLARNFDDAGDRFEIQLALHILGLERRLQA